MAAKRFPALILLFLLLACSTDRIGADLIPLDIDFVWPVDQKCFDPRSPAITISGPTGDIAMFRVRMMDLDNMHDHGGGTAPNDPSGTIAMGALTGYQGPCPGWGAPRYRITVEGLDAAGVVIAMGRKTRRWPPED